MPEKETVFSSKIAYGGVFSFKELYKFCYEWLKEETGLDISENKYEEKIVGESKNIVVEWKGEKKVTDYFKFEVEVKFTIDGLTNVEINQGGAKVNTNKGKATITVKGNLVRDYDGKFEGTAFKKYLRESYEKWVIPARVEEYSDKLSKSCDEFLSQAKAYLDLEGKK
ncbi:MAG: hypothetical protein AABX91_01185 [Nanoarchaeota archaeon]